MTVCLHHSRATATAKVVLLGIANHDGDGGAWPSIDTLARYANVTRRNVQKAIETLVRLREIEVVLQGGGPSSIADSHRPNLYRVILECPSTCDRSKNHRHRSAARLNLFEGGVSNPTPGVESDASGVSVATPEPSTKPTTRLNKEPHHLARARECPVSARISPTGEHVRLDTGCCLNCGADLRERVSA
jgi:hypothetical protein